MYTIGRLAQRTKVNADSIRFYERQGLLSPVTKTDSGYRLYTDEAVRRIAFVKRAQQCGFSLAEIRELLQMRSEDPSARLSAYSLAAQKQAQIQKTVAALQAMAQALACLVDSWRENELRDPAQLEADVLVTALEGGSKDDAARTRGRAANPADPVTANKRYVTA
jgi:MerR family transcriptional regulator, Zn(II)-responsive regulator of zntA